MYICIYDDEDDDYDGEIVVFSTILTLDLSLFILLIIHTDNRNIKDKNIIK